MDWLITRDTVIALAIAGAASSVLATVLRGGGAIDETRARVLNLAGYGFMVLSMCLFVVVGFRA